MLKLPLPTTGQCGIGVSVSVFGILHIHVLFSVFYLEGRYSKANKDIRLFGTITEART